MGRWVVEKVEEDEAVGMSYWARYGLAGGWAGGWVNPIIC